MLLLTCMNNKMQVTKSKTGQTVLRNSAGKFVSLKKVKRNSNVRKGSLYSYRGQTVRAGEQYEKGQRLVSVHGVLNGMVKDKDLAPINKRKVNQYLEHSKNA
jgi:hypothetical protein